ncbi:MAG: DNA primase [Bacillota bacterium]|nr:DNA primase [Bacillota bacterium]
MNIPEEIIRKVLEQNDIIDVISEKVKLKKSGRNYFGLCPFHNEKSPSFSVSSEKQIFKCFGCGEAGNVINFVMKIRNIPFTEAVEVLADRAHIEISTDDDKNSFKKNTENKLYKINVEAARYFFNNLNHSSTARNYLKARSISNTTIKRFGLGYALDDWDGLINYLKIKGYSDLDLMSAGLISKSTKGSYYDKFRNRIIFPVFDYKGRLTGFGGRVLDDSKPKYLNSPETLIFKKGTNLYGLNFALKSGNTERTFIIVEGYMDCISLHQAGITNVVASLGTALTINQARLLKKYSDKVIISYDSDAAGQSATMRGLEILKEAGFDVRILKVSKGKDPDEYVRNEGKEAFIKLIEDALPLIDYKLLNEYEGIDLKNPDELIKYGKKVSLILRDLNSIERDIYIKEISEKTQIKEQSLYDLISEEIKKNSGIERDMNILKNTGYKLYLEPSYIKFERNIIKLMFLDSRCALIIKDQINSEDFISEHHKKIYSLICESENQTELKQYLETKCTDGEISKALVNILETQVIADEGNIQKYIDDFLKEMKKYKLEESKEEVMKKIKEYETKGLISESLQLAKELVALKKEINNL